MEKVTILEVGPRDGFQNVAVQIPTEDKIRTVNELVEAGLKHIETSSFVHPKWIPQLKDAEEVFKSINKPSDVVFSALVPNERGLDRAIATGVTEVVYVVPASETTAKMVFNKTIAEALDLIEPMAKTASSNGVKFRATIACAFGCAFEGHVPLERVVSIGRRMQDAGTYLVTIADSMGVSGPGPIAERSAQFIDAMGKGYPVSVHFHNTMGIGLVNCFAAIGAGVRIVESSIAGLGGDPLTPGAPGNVATEGLAYLLQKMEFSTGVDLEKLKNCATYIRGRVDELERSAA